MDRHEGLALLGHRVLVTRRVERSQRFAKAIAEYGGEAICTPLTEICPPDPPDAETVARLLGGLRGYDWVIFTSASAVTRTFEELAALSMDAGAFEGARVACVGRATAATLLEHGLAADVVPERGDAVGLARAVAAAAGTDLVGARILMPRAKYGRDEAPTALRAAGATVDVAPVYSTRSVTPGDPSLTHGLTLLRAGQIDVCAFFAPSQVEALFDVCDEAGVLLRQCKAIAAIGKSTETALVSRGVPVHIVPETPSADVLAAQIAARITNAPTGRAGSNEP